jgi:hypothetical protein
MACVDTASRHNPTDAISLCIAQEYRIELPQGRLDSGPPGESAEKACSKRQESRRVLSHQFTLGKIDNSTGDQANDPVKSL